MTGVMHAEAQAAESTFCLCYYGQTGGKMNKRYKNTFLGKVLANIFNESGQAHPFPVCVDTLICRFGGKYLPNGRP